MSCITLSSATCRRRGCTRAIYQLIPTPTFMRSPASSPKSPRDDAKGVNFAKIYGAGVKKFAEMIGKPLREAQAIYTRYARRLPFLSRLAEAAQREANRLGYTVLYDGARRHWDRWAPRDFRQRRRALLARRSATTHP